MNKCVALTRSWQAAEQKKSFWAAKYCKKSTFLAQINFADGKICHRDLCLKVGAKSKNQFDAMPRRATNISRLKAYPSFLLQVFWYRDRPNAPLCRYAAHSPSIDVYLFLLGHGRLEYLDKHKNISYYLVLPTSPEKCFRVQFSASENQTVYWCIWQSL